MNEWAKVVTQPLGLAGFGLFLIFRYLARVTRRNERRWLSPVAVGLATVALIGGFALAYEQTHKPPVPSIQTSNQPPVPQQTNKVQQSSSGNGSPNVQGVQGDLTITVDQSRDKTSINKVVKKTEKPTQSSQ
jgi:hypothetical protein